MSSEQNLTCDSLLILNDLAKSVYNFITTIQIEGNGLGLLEAKPSINIVHHLRNAKVEALKDDYHPFCK